MDPDMYMRHVDIFSYYSLCFSSYILSKKTLSFPTSSTIAWQTCPIITTSCMTSSPYIPLFTPYSPVICKDNFSLVYMYKSSRYYAVFHHWFGSYVPSVNHFLSLEIGSTAAFKYFGLYCQWLPRLSIKSTYYYPYSLYFHTRLTFNC